jgi:predicted 3-demethylubiquinone-9 3-methyltransferase (glyoxalase superfamily)
MSKIAPCLWFNGDAEQAAEFYCSLFPDAGITSILRYGADATFPLGTALMVEFTLAGQRFQALNGGPQYIHSAAISLSISVRNDVELDHYWSALTGNGGAEVQCGWLIDRFGVSWQIVPDGLLALLSDPDPGRAQRAMKAMMGMVKLDIHKVREAADEQ